MKYGVRKVLKCKTNAYLINNKTTELYTKCKGLQQSVIQRRKSQHSGTENKSSQHNKSEHNIILPSCHEAEFSITKSEDCKQKEIVAYSHKNCNVKH